MDSSQLLDATFPFKTTIKEDDRESCATLSADELQVDVKPSSHDNFFVESNANADVEMMAAPTVASGVIF